jgi:hypothetical protein
MNPFLFVLIAVSHAAMFLGGYVAALIRKGGR